MTPAHKPHRWRASSLALITAVWAILQLGGLFNPGLLDDVDSIYIQIAREMLARHDFVTPTIDGIRFFDKPPLMYWLAAASMHLFGPHDWSARLPLALGVLALLLAVYALGIRFFAPISPHDAPDRGGLYAALALATSIGVYLYTRFYIPDILIALWLTLAIHLFLIALDRTGPTPRERHPERSAQRTPEPCDPERSAQRAVEGSASLPLDPGTPSPLLPMLAFGAVLALDVLTKGLIGIVFPVLFVLLYLAITRNLRALARLHLPATTLVFATIAAPWHILAAFRNPPVPMPPGLGLPARAGWAWFYLYNEHIARFLGRRIPHDYGQVPIPLFWLLLFLWLIPWAAFLPDALRNVWQTLRPKTSPSKPWALTPDPPQQPALTCLLWAGIVLGFFTLSSRQEYYHLPALPALALLAAGLLAAADRTASTPHSARTQTLRAARYVLLPLGALLAILCTILALTAPALKPGLSLNNALNSNPDLYNLSLGHVFDLTGAAMAFFRGPLLATAVGMLTLGPIAYLVRRQQHTFAANLLIVAGMTTVLLAAHEGLARFYPILGSRELARSIARDDPSAHAPVLIDGELTAGSSLLFYLDNPVLLVNGRINGPWFGSFWPDAPHIFLDDTALLQQWRTQPALYLLTYHPDQRIPELCTQGPVFQLDASGGKTILRNSPGGSQVNLCTH